MIIPSLTPSTVTMTGNNSMIGTAVLNKSLDSFELSSEGIIRMMEQSVNPLVGQFIDLKI
jgi:hypothetical protein